MEKKTTESYPERRKTEVFYRATYPHLGRYMGRGFTSTRNSFFHCDGWLELIHALMGHELPWFGRKRRGKSCALVNQGGQPFSCSGRVCHLSGFTCMLSCCMSCARLSLSCYVVARRQKVTVKRGVLKVPFKKKIVTRCNYSTSAWSFHSLRLV